MGEDLENPGVGIKEQPPGLADWEKGGLEIFFNFFFIFIFVKFQRFTKRIMGDKGLNWADVWYLFKSTLIILGDLLKFLFNYLLL